MNPTPPPDQDFSEYPRPDCPWCGKSHEPSENCSAQRYRDTTNWIVFFGLIGYPLICCGACSFGLVDWYHQGEIWLSIGLGGWLLIAAYIGFRIAKLKKLRSK